MQLLDYIEQILYSNNKTKRLAFVVSLLLIILLWSIGSYNFTSSNLTKDLLIQKAFTPNKKWVKQYYQLTDPFSELNSSHTLQVYAYLTKPQKVFTLVLFTYNKKQSKENMQDKYSNILCSIDGIQYSTKFKTTNGYGYIEIKPTVTQQQMPKGIRLIECQLIENSSPFFYVKNNQEEILTVIQEKLLPILGVGIKKFKTEIVLPQWVNKKDIIKIRSYFKKGNKDIKTTNTFYYDQAIERIIVSIEGENMLDSLKEAIVDIYIKGNYTLG